MMRSRGLLLPPTVVFTAALMLLLLLLFGAVLWLLGPAESDARRPVCIEAILARIVQ